MKIKGFYVMLMMVIANQLSFAQKNIKDFVNSLDNKKLKYEVIIKSPEFSHDSIYVSRYLMKVQSVNVPSLIEKFGDKELTEALIKCLNDEKKDWYANALLYHISGKEAMIFTVIENRKDWVKNHNRERDLEFWKKYH